MIAGLLLAAQVAATPLPSVGTPPQRIVLTNCPKGAGDEIVVCGTTDTPRLPLPGERGPPDRPVPGNPQVTGMGALAMVPTPCAATQWGCQVGVDVFGMGTTLVRLVGKAIDPDSCCERPGESTSAGLLLADTVGGIRNAFRKKPDKTGRVAIDLDAPPPGVAGRLSR